MTYFTINTNIADPTNYASNKIEFNSNGSNYIDFHKNNTDFDYSNYEEASIFVKILVLMFLISIIGFIIYCIIITSIN